MKFLTFSRTNLNNSGQWKEMNSANIKNHSLVNNDHLRARNDVIIENVRIRDKRSPSAGPSNSSNTGSLLRNKMDKRRTSSTSSMILYN